jgi:peptidoglycan/xylan/chitin deacetylase (PgdA/CDA1 family)
MSPHAFRWGVACFIAVLAGSVAGAGDELQRDEFGAIVRGDVAAKRMALVFTGDEYGEGAAAILDALKERGLYASFFLTGNFLRNEEFAPVVERMIAEGHYVGPHSDGHLLYASWDDRARSTIDEATFAADLQKNLAELRAVGAAPEGATVFFVPPFEWYNRDQVEWSRKLGVEVVNLTPGPGANRDYAPEGDDAFVPARQIYDDVLAFDDESPDGINGVLLLMHLGSGRMDPFHPLVGELCDELVHRGYEPVRVDQLCAAAMQPIARDPRYPPHWWTPVSAEGAPEWEILPQAAAAGEVILSKRHELGLLSNFAPTPFTFRGQRYASVEGFWQMMKYPEDADDPRADFAGNTWTFTRREVGRMTAFAAKDAGDLGSRNMRLMGIDWISFEGERFPYRPAKPGRHYELIVAAMRAKLEQNPEVRRVLMATGDLVLKPDHHQEENPPAAWRYFDIWMELRAELQEQ